MNKKVILFCCGVNCLFFSFGMEKMRKEQLKYLPLNEKGKRGNIAAQLHLLHNNKRPQDNCLRYPATKSCTEKK